MLVRYDIGQISYAINYLIYAKAYLLSRVSKRALYRVIILPPVVAPCGGSLWFPCGGPLWWLPVVASGSVLGIVSDISIIQNILTNNDKP